MLLRSVWAACDAGHRLAVVYDLKGSWVNRFVESVGGGECGGGGTPTLKDTNLRRNGIAAGCLPLPVGPDEAADVVEQLEADTLLLRSLGRTDYSLLLGLVPGEPGTSRCAGIVVGLVDVLQTWTAGKAAEACAKTHLLRKDGLGISAAPPDRYQARFMAFMRQIFAQGVDAGEWAAGRGPLAASAVWLRRLWKAVAKPTRGKVGYITLL